MAATKRKHDGFSFLLGATALTIVLWYVPYADRLVYPLRIFVTFMHETAHALAALATGGAVERIEIASNGSGLTYTRGGWSLLIASAGYVGTMLYGGLLLMLSKQAKHARLALVGTSLLVGLVTLFWVKPILSFGFSAGVALTIGLAATLYLATARVTHFLVSFLGVQSCLNSLFDLKTLFLLSAHTNVPTDAMTLEQMTMIPAILWALAWVGISLLILFLALRSYRSALPKL
ncbi:MAG: M50 family metallopeptidase [Acidobacteriota bacterium]|nr:M50 family metallopeptidase [Blastocatellia bacterium]MDW8239833.1 M50 family metallopeptidase [Acidobacteriota bacterium]